MAKTKPPRHKDTKPRDPRTPEEWQEAVDAASFYLLIDSARKYGLITGGPAIDLRRCEELLKRGKRLGYLPTPDAAEQLRDEMMGLRRCRVCGCTDEHGCDEGCEWVEWNLCSACAGKEAARRG